jgi:enoyl-CoA hydratase
MAESLLTLETSDGVALLTLNRPEKRNALSVALRNEIVRRIDELEKSNDVRVAILIGAGPAFCAGFDRSELSAGNMAEIFVDATAYHRRVYRFPKPLIAAVNGPALGGGCDLAAMCDFRLAATTASFGQPQVRFGAPAIYELMRTVIGSGPAREMCLTGRRYDAREALAIGLVNRVVEPPELMETARGLAREIATLPEGLAEAIKRSFLSKQPALFEPGDVG